MAVTDIDDPFVELLGGAGALDCPFLVSFFDNKRDTGRQEQRTTLRELAEIVHQPERAGKDDLPLLNLSAFGQDRSGGKALRNAANITAVWGVEGDHDAGTVTIAEAEARLRQAGIAALLYSTPSSKPASPRWRVLAPASSPMEPAARTELVARLDAALGGCLAPESYRLGQAYFYGRVANSESLESALVEGDFLDRVSVTSSESSTSSCPQASASEEDLLHEIATGQSFHQALTSLIGRWLREGVSPEGCTTRAVEAMEAVPAADRDNRWHDRSQDIPRLVRDLTKREQKRQRIAYEAMVAEFDDLPEMSPALGRLKLLRPGDCAAVRSRGYVVKGLIAPSDLACIFGPPGAGKSLIAPLIAYKVAQGRPTFGMRTKPGRVLYVAAEDPHGMSTRITALRQRHGEANDFMLVDGVADLLTAGSEDMRELRAHVREQRPAVVVIDTLAMAFPGLEENSAEGMGRVVAISRKLTETGAAVVLIHHDTKAGSPTPRGHSLLNGALDVALQLTAGDEDGVIRAKLTKNRNGRSDREFAFTIATEHLGEDEDGDAIEAPLAEPCDAETGKRPPKLTGSERAALKVLRNVSDFSGRVEEAVFRRACIDGREVSAAEEPESRARAVRRAIEGLSRKGYIKVTDGTVALNSNGTSRPGVDAMFEDLPPTGFDD